jgi:HEAT repeat protein
MTGATMLRDRVLQRDWSSLDDLKSATDADADDLSRLVVDSSPEVRELALACLDTVGGPRAREAFLLALHDPDEQLRARASIFLRAHLGGVDAGALHAELQSNDDEYVREQIALATGEVGDPRSIEPLRARREVEPDPFVREAIDCALARLGDSQGREALAARLALDDPRQRVAAVRGVEYAGDPRLVSDLCPLLADLRDAVNIGASHATYFLRVSDVAARALGRLLSVPLGFDLAPPRRYTDAELGAALRSASHPQL